jgi:Leucine-rich repeat (LRR) protein
MNFYEKNIKQIYLQQELTKLQVLIISFNQISSLSTLDKCPNLEILDVSYNILTNIENAGKLLNLKKLFLHFN